MGGKGMNLPGNGNPPSPGKPPEVEGKKPPGQIAAACLFAWAIPGAGHFYFGKKVRAAVFFGLVLTTFVLGLVQGGKMYLVDRSQPLSYLATFANLALGPLDIVGREVVYDRLVYRMPGDNGPEARRLLNLTRERIRQETYEYGTTFLLTAGLMNILLILDVFDIGIGRKG